MAKKTYLQKREMFSTRLPIPLMTRLRTYCAAQDISLARVVTDCVKEGLLARERAARDVARKDNSDVLT